MYVSLLCRSTGKYLKICYYWTGATMRNHLPKQNIVAFLRQVNLRIDGRKNVAAMAKFQRVWEHFTIWLWCTTVRSFSHILSLPYFPSERVIIFFAFWCVRGVGFVDVAELLSLKVSSHYLTWSVIARCIIHISLP